MRRAALLVAALIVASAGRAEASPGFGLYKLDPQGRVRGIWTADVDRDGRLDLVVMVDPRGETGERTRLLVLRTPASPVPGTFFPPTESWPISDATAAIAIGRFGEGGASPFRWIGDGIRDATVGEPAGRRIEGALPPLLRGVAGTPPIFWDGVADLDGDGRDESWYPTADGRVAVLGTAGGTLDLSVSNEAATNERDLMRRTVRVPSLTPADVDGDGRQELLSLSGSALTIWRADAGAWKKDRVVALPFLEPDPTRPPEEIRTPRIRVLDADGDGKADMLVTMVQGRADKIGGLRTSLLHYPGPFWDEKGALRPPKSRIDTESVGLHPRFVDVNGDGRVDYVADSIRGTMFDLIQRVMGKEPEVTFTAFLFDPATGTYEGSPYATFTRPYSGDQARSNVFGQSGWFDGDFDGDGHKDLLDLGNLTGVEILKGKPGGSAASGGRASFSDPLLERVRISKGIASDARIADLNADGRSDAILWNDDSLFLIVSKP